MLNIVPLAVMSSTCALWTACWCYFCLYTLLMVIIFEYHFCKLTFDLVNALMFSADFLLAFQSHHYMSWMELLFDAVYHSHWRLSGPTSGILQCEELLSVLIVRGFHEKSILIKSTECRMNAVFSKLAETMKCGPFQILCAPEVGHKLSQNEIKGKKSFCCLFVIS